MLGVELWFVTVEEELPPFIMDTAPPGAYITQEVMDLIDDQNISYYGGLTQEAVALAQEQGVTLHAAAIAGDEVDSIVDHVRDQKADLLLIGFHRHSRFVDRFLGRTSHVPTLAAPCCVFVLQ